MQKSLSMWWLRVENDWMALNQSIKVFPKQLGDMQWANLGWPKGASGLAKPTSEVWSWTQKPTTFEGGRKEEFQELEKWVALTAKNSKRGFKSTKEPRRGSASRDRSSSQRKRGLTFSHSWQSTAVRPRNPRSSRQRRHSGKPLPTTISSRSTGTCNAEAPSEQTPIPGLLS